MDLKHNPHFEFKNNLHAGWCDVKVYSYRNGINTLLITEPIDNEGDYANRGLSVVNGIEHIVWGVYKEYDINPDFVIEYLPHRHEAYRMMKHGIEVSHSASGSEDLSLVTFKHWFNGSAKIWSGMPYKRPIWIPIKRDTVCDIIGLDYFPEWLYDVNKDKDGIE